MQLFNSLKRIEQNPELEKILINIEDLTTKVPGKFDDIFEYN